VGGVPAVMKYLLKEGLHGHCLTVTGKTIAENLATVPDLNDGQDVIHKIQKALKYRKYPDPLWKSVIGCVAKISGRREYFEGDANSGAMKTHKTPTTLSR
jgi:dihydroxy-acid dehydratase